MRRGSGDFIYNLQPCITTSSFCNNTPPIFLPLPLPLLISFVALLQIFPLEVNHRDQKLNITNKETESQNLCQNADIHQEDEWVIHKRDMRMSLSQLHTLFHNFTI